MQYVYALGTRPLAQYGTVWEYLLADALGSVRQLARGYTPYGEPLWMNGTASSRYAFKGEDYDSYIRCAPRR